MLSRKIKTTLLRAWLSIPGGRICTLHRGRQTITLRKNLWVHITDGTSKDALPICLVSPDLVDALRKRMDDLGYPPPGAHNANA